MVWKSAVLMVGLSGSVLLAGGNVCDGQQLIRYQPNSPTISPYLNLLRANNGGLPNYYAFVRPQTQQGSFDARETSLRRQQQVRIQQLEREIRETQDAVLPTGKASWFMIPGTRSVFQDTSQYYPQVTIGR